MLFDYQLATRKQTAIPFGIPLLLDHLSFSIHYTALKTKNGMRSTCLTSSVINPCTTEIADDSHNNRLALTLPCITTNQHLCGSGEKMEHKRGQTYIHDAYIVAVVVDEKHTSG